MIWGKHICIYMAKGGARARNRRFFPLFNLLLILPLIIVLFYSYAGLDYCLIILGEPADEKPATAAERKRVRKRQRESLSWVPECHCPLERRRDRAARRCLSKESEDRSRGGLYLPSSGGRLTLKETARRWRECLHQLVDVLLTSRVEDSKIGLIPEDYNSAL